MAILTVSSLTRAGIAGVLPYRYVLGETVFDVRGAEDGTTPFASEIDTRPVGAPQGSTWIEFWGSPLDRTVGTEEALHTRVVQWRFSTTSPGNDLTQVTGKVSVDNRWPLEFESEPFRVSKLKKGQKLKFKYFALTLPR